MDKKVLAWAAGVIAFVVGAVVFMVNGLDREPDDIADGARRPLGARLAKWLRFDELVMSLAEWNTNRLERKHRKARAKRGELHHIA